MPIGRAPAARISADSTSGSVSQVAGTDSRPWLPIHGGYSPALALDLRPHLAAALVRGHALRPQAGTAGVAPDSAAVAPISAPPHPPPSHPLIRRRSQSRRSPPLAARTPAARTRRARTPLAPAAAPPLAPGGPPLAPAGARPAALAPPRSHPAGSSSGGNRQLKAHRRRPPSLPFAGRPSAAALALPPPSAPLATPASTTISAESSCPPPAGPRPPAIAERFGPAPGSLPMQVFDRNRATSACDDRHHDQTKMARRRPRQLALPAFGTWGGRRPGAGRKSARDRPGPPHACRPKHQIRHPVHVTLRAGNGVPSLRSQAIYPALRRAFAACSRRSFRLLHFSVQSNHLHLIVEADAAQALTRGLQGLAVRCARAVNRCSGRRGSVWGQRYHAHALATPREVRLGLVYVLLKFREAYARTADGRSLQLRRLVRRLDAAPAHSRTAQPGQPATHLAGHLGLAPGGGAIDWQEAPALRARSSRAAARRLPLPLRCQRIRGDLSASRRVRWGGSFGNADRPCPARAAARPGHAALG